MKLYSSEHLAEHAEEFERKLGKPLDDETAKHIITECTPPHVVGRTRTDYFYGVRIFGCVIPIIVRYDRRIPAIVKIYYYPHPIYDHLKDVPFLRQYVAPFKARTLGDVGGKRLLH